MSRWNITWMPASPRGASHLGIGAGMIGAVAMMAPQVLHVSGVGFPPIAHMIVRIVLAISGIGMVLSALTIAVIIGSGYRWPTVNRSLSINPGSVGR